jgi:hypothetical protein
MNLPTWLLAQMTQPARFDLTPGGWIIMLLSVGFVTSLLAFCIWRVTRESSASKVPAPQEVDTRDLNEN